MKNIPSESRSKVASFVNRLLYTSLLVCGLGIVSTPARAASVTVDPAPLIVQASLPPNITLMLDDSGSMAWDYMPDACYLNGVTCTGTNNGTTPSGGGTDTISTVNNNAMINSNNNGVYYNPTTTYILPYKADGTQYPNAGLSTSPLTSVVDDGFSSSPNTVDLTNYSTSDITGENGNGNTTLNYSASNTVTTPGSNSTATFSGVTVAQCNADYANQAGAYGGASWTASKRNGTTGTCTFTYGLILPTSNTYNYFQYSTGPAAGAYVVNYVAATNCGSYSSTTTPSCVLATDTSGAAAPSGVAAGQNIANWFAYYHTRILMAKSGLMNSFSNVSSSYRVGFGSINGRNNSGLPSSTAAFTSSDGSSTTIAQVAPFGDGSSGTQKANFWNWLIGESARNGTRLRNALDAVGQYYQSSQPWTTMSSDPDPTTNANTELACRQSYTILTTDGFWNDSYSGAGTADDVTGPTINGANSQTYTYTPTLPYSDSTIGTTTTSYTACTEYVSKNTTSTLVLTGAHAGMCQVVTSSKRGSTTVYDQPCSGTDVYNSNTQKCTSTTTTGTTYSDSLANVAMQYWENDLRPNTTNEVPPSSQDPAFWQHMTTFTVGLGFTPVGITPSSTTVSSIFTWADGGAAISGFGWPQPASNSINNISDLVHAGVNGHGGFYSATNPKAFSDGLKDALARAAERVGTGASLAANSTELQTGTVAYQATYHTGLWWGDLQALSVNSSSGAISSTPSWTASGSLPAAASRTIETTDMAGNYLAFQVSSSGTLPALSTAQATALSSISSSGTSATEADMINYLRGDNTKEQSQASGIYRTRTTPLGDIVDSQPVYVGAPNANQFYNETFTGSSAFSAYATSGTASSRNGVVYVAANDGMLHGFDATSGKEVYAYLPGAVITQGLTALADPNYGQTVSHQYFNDGELTVADAYLSDSAWHTVLVGTTGRGLAKAVYALDVTDPTSVKFLWERSAGDGNTADGNSKYIGQMIGKPVIAQTANGTWSVLIGNGYNSAAGKAALLQFDLSTGTLYAHTTTDTSGLAAPAVWMSPSGNGVSTSAYAGDADGDVWSFAFSSSTGTSTPSSAGTLLYTAEDASGNAQPITGGMLAGQDPTTGNLWVFFGTGQYLSAADLTNTNTQSWYGLIVQSANSTFPAVTSTMTRTANLAQRSITAQSAGSSTSLPARTVTTLANATSLSAKSGWYIDLLEPVTTTTGGTTTTSYTSQGERMVTPNQFQGDLLLGTTRIPQATDACNPSGTGWIMAINPFTGTNPAASFFDINGDGSINSSDNINGTPAAGVGFSSLPNNPIFVGSSMLTSFDNGTTSSLKTSSSTGALTRVSWKELINP